MSNRNKSKTPVEIASDFVTETIDSAKAAFNGDNGVAKEGLDAINQSAQVYQARFAELQAKGLDIVEANTKALLAFWREATAVKSPEALFALQQDFLKAQSNVAVKQFQDLNNAGVAMVRDAAAPVQDSLAKFPGFTMPKAA